MAKYRIASATISGSSETISDNVARTVPFDTAVEYFSSSDVDTSSSGVRASATGLHMITCRVGVTGNGSDTALSITLSLKNNGTTFATAMVDCGQNGSIEINQIATITNGNLITAEITVDGDNAGTKSFTEEQANTLLQIYFLE